MLVKMAVAAARRLRRRIRPRGAKRGIDGRATLLALFGHEADAGRNRRPRAGPRQGPPVERDGSRRRPVGSGDQAQKLRASGADQSGDAEHLAAAQVETRVDDLRPGAEVAHRQNRFGGCE
jgi:hypothetical protein